MLVSPRNPLNIGAAARAMSNFGFARLAVVNAYQVAYREAKSAVNAGAVMQASRNLTTVSDAIAHVTLVIGTSAAQHRELQHTMRRLEPGGKLLRAHLENGKAAILFGSEKYGLSNDDLSYCDWLVRVPTRVEHPSMNLGQAVAVCLYELIRQARPVHSVMPVKPADAQDVERLTALWVEAMEASGYIKPPTDASMRLKLRRLIRRLNIADRDIEMWHGMLRQMLWSLRTTSTKHPPKGD